MNWPRLAGGRVSHGGGGGGGVSGRILVEGVGGCGVEGSERNLLKLSLFIDSSA